MQIPTNKPMIRKDMNDVVYKTETGKFSAVVEEIVKRHADRPARAGGHRVGGKERDALHACSKQRGVQHEVLNAKYHEKEAEIVAQAGK